jgi:hypothetical protein
MAKAKQEKQLLHKYLLVPLESLIQHPHLAFMLWPTDPEKWAEARSLLFNKYAVSEHHPNVSIIAVYVDKPEWINLNGDHQEVRPMI